MARNLSRQRRNNDGEGHNSGSINGEALASEVETVAQYMREQKEIGVTIKDRCKDAADAGLCTSKELRQLARERLKDADVLQDHLDRMASLRDALGPYINTPLGSAAMERGGARL